MGLFLLIYPILFYLRDFISVSELFSLSQTIHKQCLNQVSFESEWIDIYQALICGKKLPYGETKQIFIQGGCIHLMVVSGAHLLFLEKLWRKVPLPFFKTIFLFFILGIYALASQLHPPITRAFFSFLLFFISKSNKLFWNSHSITHLSGLLCLLLNPEWVFSISLQLSWLASFLQNLRTSRSMKALVIYLFIFPVVSQWHGLHPFTVFVNWSVAPLMGSLLFPFTFITLLIPPLHHLTDILWTMLLSGLKLFNVLSSSLFFPRWSLPRPLLWPYVILVFIVTTVVETRRRRHFPLKFSDSKKDSAGDESSPLDR